MSKRLVVWLCATVTVGGMGCGSAAQEEATVLGATSDPLAGTNAQGTIPAALPARLGVGLFGATDRVFDEVTRGPVDHDCCNGGRDCQRKSH